MYECPNCGGNLKFDIKSQLLKCDYCLTTKDPYEVTKEKDAEEKGAFDVTVFTCPQCGGEILSTDTSAAEFCSFCGASTILDSRISKEKRPARIIPFQITKEDCKKAYMKRMKLAFFAPDELKQEKYIDGFRGIYMPYWVYNLYQKGEVRLNGEKSYRRGDYIYTDHYELSGNIDAEYRHLPFDASSSFDDNISERIAPYNFLEEKDFTPSFLSGFYADTADVENSVYRNEAEDLANDASLKKIRKDPVFKDLTIPHEKGKNHPLSSRLNTLCDTPERVLYPVWFMSYRRNDRVAYATVNGQTGKIMAEIPVDIKKYVYSTLILAILLFFLLNVFFTITASFALSLSVLLSIVTLFIYAVESAQISGKDKRKGDKGYLYMLKARAIKKDGSQAKPKKKKEGKKNSDNFPGFLGSALSIIMALFIQKVDPVSDIWYYTGALLAFFGILFTMADIIKKYNLLATRSLPQFNRHGGDDNA